MPKHAPQDTKPAVKTDNGQLSVGKRFNGYGPEEELSSNKADIKRDPALEKVERAWGKFVRIHSLPTVKKSMTSFEYFESYEIAVLILEDLTYDSETVEAFCVSVDLAIETYGGYSNLGIFLGALVNCGQDSNYRAFSMDSWPEMFCLLTKNKRDVTFNGDGGTYFGSDMISGRLEINGNVGYALGANMEGGLIIVNGNVIPEESSETPIGADMTGGEIHINGKIIADHDYLSRSWDRVKSGKIFHNGKLIVDK
jgi:hypothetical protein